MPRQRKNTAPSMRRSSTTLPKASKPCTKKVKRHRMTAASLLIISLSVIAFFVAAGAMLRAYEKGKDEDQKTNIIYIHALINDIVKRIDELEKVNGILRKDHFVEVIDETPQHAYTEYKPPSNQCPYCGEPFGSEHRTRCQQCGAPIKMNSNFNPYAIWSSKHG